MKAVFIILLCGLSSALGKFNCNQDYPKECIDRSAKEYGDTFPETPVELKEYCKNGKKEAKCYLDFADECPKTLTAVGRQAYVDFLNALNRICNKNDPIQQKYFEKVHCLNENFDSSKSECQSGEEDPDYCKSTLELLNCHVDTLSKKCGKDSQELVALLFKQKFSLRKVFCP